MRTYPSILEKTRDAIQSKINKTPDGIHEVQIDICDGIFVPSKTYGSTGTLRSLKLIRKVTKGKELEFDLMVDLHKTKKRKRFLSHIKSVQPERVIIHYGTNDSWNEVFEILAKKGKLGMKVGLGIHLSHSSTAVYELLDTYPFSFVQVMGIEKVGYSGQSFSSKTYTKIRAIRKRYPNMPISVDGGVKLSNAEKLKDAGATRICPNSGLFKTEDITQTYKQFKEI